MVEGIAIHHSAPSSFFQVHGGERMKKILMLISACMIFSGLAFATAGDYVTWQDIANTEFTSIDANGDFQPRRSTIDLGSTASRFSSVVASTLNCTSYSNPIIAQDTWVDLPTASSVAIYCAPVASGTIYLANSVLGVNVLTQMKYGRNIWVGCHYRGVDQQKTVVTNFTIAGINCHGESVSEVVTVSTWSHMIGGIGKDSSNAYLYISSITVRVTTLFAGAVADTTLEIGIGYGNKIGLSNDIITSTDLISASEGSAISSPGTLKDGIDTTYDTIDFITDANASNDYTVWYKVMSKP